MGRDASGTFTGTIIVDPKELGGNVTLIVEGRKFNVSDRLKRGLRTMAAEISEASR